MSLGELQQFFRSTTGGKTPSPEVRALGQSLKQALTDRLPGFGKQTVTFSPPGECNAQKDRPLQVVQVVDESLIRCITHAVDLKNNLFYCTPDQRFFVLRQVVESKGFGGQAPGSVLNAAQVISVADELVRKARFEGAVR